jgi:hypothetical protein
MALKVSPSTQESSIMMLLPLFPARAQAPHHKQEEMPVQAAKSNLTLPAIGTTSSLLRAMTRTRKIQVLLRLHQERRTLSVSVLMLRLLALLAKLLLLI